MSRVSKRDGSGSMLLLAEKRQNLAPNPEELRGTTGRFSSGPTNIPTLPNIESLNRMSRKKHTLVKYKVSYQRDQDRNRMETIGKKSQKWEKMANEKCIEEKHSL